MISMMGAAKKKAVKPKAVTPVRPAAQGLNWKTIGIVAAAVGALVVLGIISRRR